MFTKTSFQNVHQNLFFVFKMFTKTSSLSSKFSPKPFFPNFTNPFFKNVHQNLFSKFHQHLISQNFHQNLFSKCSPTPFFQHFHRNFFSKTLQLICTHIAGPYSGQRVELDLPASINGDEVSQAAFFVFFCVLVLDLV